MRNYLKLSKFSLFNAHYMFLDCNDYFADQLFIKHKVRVKFEEEFGKKDSPYCVILCSIRKKDEKGFLSALSEMENKMILLGYRDYHEFCKEVMTTIQNKGSKTI